MLQIKFDNRLLETHSETGDGGDIGQLRLDLALIATNRGYTDGERRFASYALQTLQAYEQALKPQTSDVDYKALLEKYIQHVAYEEGATFINRCHDSEFTPAEIAELKRIDATVD